uniref:Uncharacterized protein n=1 Tax=Fagus sylvatica TaxID=28930 RepID=A0A2N9HZE9_FAGSY
MFRPLLVKGRGSHSMVVVDGVVVGNRLGLADLSLGWLCSTISVSATVELYLVVCDPAIYSYT